MPRGRPRTTGSSKDARKNESVANVAFKSELWRMRSGPWPMCSRAANKARLPISSKRAHRVQ